MAPLKTEGIILRRRDYRESDLIVTFFSRDFGKLTGVAFGAKRSQKRFANCLQLFNRSRIFFSERPHRNLVRMELCELLRGCDHISRDMNVLAHASYMAELTSSLTGGRDKNEDLYYLLAKCLDLLESGGLPEEAARIFEVRLLTVLGYGLNLENCLGCKESLDQQGQCCFEPSKGGLWCERCAPGHGLAISEGTVKALHFAQNQPLEAVGRLRFSKGSREEARILLENFLVQLMQKRPKSLDFIRQLKDRKTTRN